MPTLHAKQIFIILAVTLFSFSANAQITTTVSGGTSGTSSTGNFGTLCGTNTNGHVAGLPILTNNSNAITITYSSPVTAVLIPFSDFGINGIERHRLDVLGQSDEVLSFGCPKISVSGNIATSNNLPSGHGKATISSSIPFTQIVITSPDGFNLHIPTSDFFNTNNFIISAPQCPSTPVVPTLSAVTLSNACPATTANLTSITASNTPANATLTWHTSTPATNANKIANPAAVTAGTYSAAFYYSEPDCYSDENGNGTTAVTVTINSCCNAGTVAPSFNQ